MPFQKIWILAQKTAFLAQKSIFVYATPKWPNSPETDPTQWDHIFPMSWGNPGYPRFSSRCPFSCSAGRFLAPIAQNSSFLSQNAIFGPLVIGHLSVTVVAFPVIGDLPVIVVAYPVIGDLIKSPWCLIFFRWFPVIAIPLHGIACYCVVGFGERAVSHTTPIYFMIFDIRE